VMAESVLLSLLGGAASLVVGAVICHWLRQYPAVFVSLNAVVMTPGVMAITLAVSILVGIAGSLAPAFATARHSIVEAIRFTD
jgi:ABC-type antimicrobial peptide transport system permease subunit